MNNNPIDQAQLMLIVTATQGMTREDMIDRLNTDVHRMNRAQREAVKRCWLFVQTQGKIRRYFTMKYAVDHKLKKTLKPDKSSKEKKLGNRTVAGYQHSPYTIEFMKHCKLIDSYWITGRA